MIRFKFLSTAVIVSALSATAAKAQHMIEEPGAFALVHPNGDLGIGSTRSPADAMALLPGAAGMDRMRMEITPHPMRAKRQQPGKAK